ncbi:18183_t:CDS:2, partial [Gigaspora rosea]
MSQKIKVNVIDAGVIGLTTALVLQRNGYQVRILSEHWPGDLDINYSSPWAAAAWRANLHIDDERFRVIPPKELPSGVEYGVSYTTVSLNVQKYLQWLLDQFTTNGGIRKKTFGGVMDTTVFPSRGQTVSVWAPHIKTVHILTNRDSFTFVVPRESGEVILGGTMDMNDYSENPDPKTAEDIIQRCVKLCPELTLGKESQDLQIIRHNVGRRPYRKNGIRLEVEIRKNAKNKDVIVCHNYGHNSYGYSSSWGSCLEAFKLIEK